MRDTYLSASTRVDPGHHVPQKLLLCVGERLEVSVPDELLIQLGSFDLHRDHRLVQRQTLGVRFDLVEDLTVHVVPGFLLRVSQRSTGICVQLETISPECILSCTLPPDSR